MNAGIPERRCFLAYATANEAWRLFRDAMNFRRLAEHDPGVPKVEVYIAVSEARRASAADRSALAELIAVAEESRCLRVREAFFKPNAGRDFSSWRACLARIVDVCGPDDYVLCLNRSAYGPLGDDWYGAFVSAFEGTAHAGLCGNSINLAGYFRHAAPEHTHVQTYAFLGRPQVIAAHMDTLPAMNATSRGEAIVGGEIALSRRLLANGYALTSLAWPGHVFTADHLYDPALPQDNVSYTLTGTPFRHWAPADVRMARSARMRLEWLLAPTVRAMRDRLRHALTGRLSRLARPVPPFVNGHASLAPRMEQGAYVLSAFANAPVGVAMAPQADAHRSICFLLQPGASVHLVVLRHEIDAPVLRLMRSGDGPVPALALVRVPAPLATLLVGLRRHTPGLTGMLYPLGPYRQLAGAAAEGAWTDWGRWLRTLWFLGIEDTTPDTPLMSGAAPPQDPRRADLPAGVTVAVHLHLHYHDLWPEIAASLARLPREVRLHVTTHRADDALCDAIRFAFPAARIEAVPNRGRDIAPFLDLLAAGAFDDCDYVCKVHGKKSGPAGIETYVGRAWRRRCLSDLLGSAAGIERIVARFEADAALGLIGPARLRLPNSRVSADAALGPNRAPFEALLARCAPKAQGVPAVDFFAGSMFWFRPGALAPLRALGLRQSDFPEEARQPDATLAHALERLIPTVAPLAGYRVEGC